MTAQFHQTNDFVLKLCGDCLAFCSSQDRSRDKKSVFQFSQSFSNKHQSSFSHIPLPLKEEIGTLSLVSALFRPSSRYQKQIGAPGTKSHHYGVLN